jgi:hypothetical protein
MKKMVIINSISGSNNNFATTKEEMEKMFGGMVDIFDAVQYMSKLLTAHLQQCDMAKIEEEDRKAEIANIKAELDSCKGQLKLLKEQYEG